MTINFIWIFVYQYWLKLKIRLSYFITVTSRICLYLCYVIILLIRQSLRFYINQPVVNLTVYYKANKVFVIRIYIQFEIKS